MSIVYIQKQGVKIARTGRRLLVKNGDEVLSEIQVMRLDSIHLFGGITVSTAALGLLMGHGVDAAFYRLDGRLKGKLTGPLSKNVKLRLAQALLHDDPHWRLKRSREIVRAKTQAARDLLIKYERKKGVVDNGRTRSKFTEYANRATQADTLDELRGLEGVAARLWFDLFPTFMPRGFSWNGRRRRPPPDPTNALLSLSYSLLSTRLTSAVDGCGLDPYLGCLHGVRHGQPSLALDLLEPFRVLAADRFVIRSINLGIFSPSHFQAGPRRGIFLNQEGKAKFFVAWEAFLKKIRWEDQMFSEITRYRKLVEASHLDRCQQGYNSRLGLNAPSRAQNHGGAEFPVAREGPCISF